MISLLIFILSTSTQVFTDVSYFRGNDGLTFSLFSIDIPYSNLSYTEDKGKLKSEFWIDVKIEGDTNLQKKWKRVSYISSYKDAEERDLRFVEEFDVMLKPGKYELNFKIESGEKKVEERKELDVKPFNSSGLMVSDMKFSTKISEEDNKLVPHPQRVFGFRYPILYVYFEVYNLNKEDFSIHYVIMDENDSIINDLPPKLIHTDSSLWIETSAINIIGLKQGQYTLTAKIKRGKEEKEVAKSFSVIKKFPKLEVEGFKPTEEQRKYWHLLRYVADEREIKNYNSLSDSGKENFLRIFWQKRGKELLDSLISMVKYADENFSSPFELGRDTDMGRIYLKYGKPDEIDTDVSGRYPFKKWIYYKKGGKIFIFVDKRNNGIYELVYSSIPEEPTDINWRRWLKEEVIR